MGFEIFVSWFERGEPAAVEFAALRLLFGPAAGPMERTGFRVRYGPDNESYVHASPERDGTLTTIAIERPCAAPELWEAVLSAMKLGHGLCYWPGDACALASADALPHMPADMAEGLAQPRIVDDGAALVRLIESS